MSAKHPAELSISLCGVARNCGEGLEETLMRIKTLDTVLGLQALIIVTNDNDDETTEVLEGWEKACPRRRVIVIDGLAQSEPIRESRLALARNAYLKELSLAASPSEYVLIMDLDGLNDEVDPRSISSAISQAPSDWVGIFANQHEFYYDLHALRCHQWVEVAVWDEVEAGAAWVRRRPWSIVNRLTRGWFSRNLYKSAVKKFVGRRQYKIPTDAAPIRVRSAFGGIGIYKWSVLSKYEYSAIDSNGNLVCEHVTLNTNISDNGGALYIIPNLINNAPREHSFSGSGRKAPKYLYNKDNV